MAIHASVLLNGESAVAIGLEYSRVIFTELFLASVTCSCFGCVRRCGIIGWPAEGNGTYREDRSAAEVALSCKSAMAAAAGVMVETCSTPIRPYWNSVSLLRLLLRKRSDPRSSVPFLFGFCSLLQLWVCCGRGKSGHERVFSLLLSAGGQISHFQRRPMHRPQLLSDQSLGSCRPPVVRQS